MRPVVVHLSKIEKKIVRRAKTNRVRSKNKVLFNVMTRKLEKTLSRMIRKRPIIKGIYSAKYSLYLTIIKVKRLLMAFPTQLNYLKGRILRWITSSLIRNLIKLK